MSFLQKTAMDVYLAAWWSMNKRPTRGPFFFSRKTMIKRHFLDSTETQRLVIILLETAIWIAASVNNPSEYRWSSLILIVLWMMCAITWFFCHGHYVNKQKPTNLS